MKINTAKNLKSEILNKLHNLYCTIGSLNAALGFLALVNECKESFEPKERLDEVFSFVIHDLLQQKWIQIYQPEDKSKIMERDGRVQVGDDTLIALTYKGVAEYEKLLKEERKDKEMQKIIKFDNISNSILNVNSDHNNSNIIKNYIEPSIFSEMRDACKAASLDHDTLIKLNASIDTLAEKHKIGKFSDGYKDFMQTISAHITVFTPFLSNLAVLL